MIKQAAAFVFALALGITVYGQSDPNWNYDESANPLNPENPWLGSHVIPDGTSNYQLLDTGLTSGDLPFVPIPYFSDSSQVIAAETGKEFAIGQAPEIVALARGLQNDPVRIYNYVRDNIDYIPYWGCRKGAMLTYLEGAGNDADQCALLKALLIEAGVASSNIKYVHERQKVPAEADAVVKRGWRKWLALEADVPSALVTAVEAKDYLLLHSVPAAVDADGTSLIVNRFVLSVTLTVEGTSQTYRLDPAMKRSLRANRLAWESLGGSLSAGTLESEAGGETGADSWAGQSIPWVKGINKDGISTQLANRSKNVLAALKASDELANSHAADLVGSWRIDPDPAASLPDAQGQVFVQVDQVSAPVEDFPMVFTSILQIAFSNGVTPIVPSAKTFEIPMPWLRGKRLSLAPNGTSVELKLEEFGILKFTPPASGSYKILFRIAHPNIKATPWAYPSFRNAGTYALMYCFRASERLLRSRQRVLELYLRTPTYTSTSTEVVAENLNVMGLTWMLQTQYLRELACGLKNCSGIYGFRIGRMAQETISTKKYCYVDAFLQTSTFLGRFHGSVDGLNADQTGLRMSLVNGFFGSAIEHAILDQTQALTESAISTVRAISLSQLHGSSSDNGWNDGPGGESMKVYLASTGAKLTAALDNLTGYADKKADMRKLLDDYGGSMLFPEKGVIYMGSWSGSAYAFLSPTGVGMTIGGGLNGGLGTFSITPNLQLTIGQTATSNLIVLDNSYGTNSQLSGFLSPDSQRFSLEPIDMRTGGYLFEKTDIAEPAAGGMPLSFSRHYSSAWKDMNLARLGYGWVHNQYGKATQRSETTTTFGKGSPQEAVPMIVAVLAAWDMYDAENLTPKRAVVTSCIARWAVDQITNTAVAVTLGKDTYQFLKVPDDPSDPDDNEVYLPPNGTNLSLTRHHTYGGQPISWPYYEMKERLGRTFTFVGEDANDGSLADNRLRYVTDQHGKRLRYSYYDGTDALYEVARESATTANSWPAWIKLEYDAAGNLYTVKLNNSNPWVAFEYSETHDLTRVYDKTLFDINQELGWTYDYDADHRITLLKDPLDRVIATNVYDAFDRVTEQRSMGDNARKWEYCFDGNRGIERNPLGGTTTYVFDAYGRVVEQSDALGNTMKTEYDGQSHVTKTTSAKGEVTQYVYGGNTLDATREQVLKEVIHPADADDAANGIATPLKTFYSYDSESRQAGVTDPRGHASGVTYTAKSQIATSTDAEGNTTTYTYDAAGNVATVKDAANNTIVITSNNTNRPATVTYPDTTTETFTYNAWGLPLTMKDRNNVTTTMTYDAMGRPLTSSTTVGGVAHVSSRTYFADGTVATETDMNGNVTSHAYNAAGKHTSTTLPVLSGQPAAVVETDYDERDWPTDTFLYRGVQNKERHTSMAYFANQWVKKNIDALGIVSEVEYDANGQVTKTTVDKATGGLNLATSAAFNARGFGKTTSEPDALDVTSTPDANGNRVRLTNRLSKTWEFAFDNNNRLLQTKTPAVAAGAFRTRAQTYNSRGLPATSTEPSGESTALTYNNVSRLVTRADAVGTATMTYDGNGNLLTVTENGQTLTRVYYALNRLTKFTDGAGNVIEYFYDKNGNLTKLRYPDTKEVTYTYNARNKLIAMVDWSGRVTSYGYDDFDRLATVTRPNRSVRTLGYDLDDRLTEIKETGAGGQLVFLRRMAYDNAGRMTSSYQLPDRPALTEVNATFTHNPDNSLATVDGSAVTIDLDGNMTGVRLSESSAGLQPASTAALIWDPRNRLTSATIGGAATTYAYDAENRRTSKTTASGTTTYAHSPGGALSQLLIETLPGGAKRWFVHGAMGIEYQVENDGTVYYLHGDQIGSVLAVTNSSAQTVKRWGYTPYGQAVSYTAAGDATTPPVLAGAPEHGYVGQFGVMTDANGLLNMRARYYSPYLRRFLNEDPIGFEGGVNWWGYVGGGPLLAMDPLGLSAGQPGFGESMIPFWGSGRAAVDDFQSGKWGWGTVNTALAISDVALVKSLAVGIGKGIGKALGIGATKELAAANVHASINVGQAVAKEATSVQAGVQLQQVGNYWVKQVDSSASAASQVWAKTSIEMQADSLSQLSSLAPSFIYREGKLVTRDAGIYSGGWGASFVEGSQKLGTVFNDIRPRNMGAGGLIFDPVFPFQQAVYAGAALTVGGLADGMIHVGRK